MTVTITMTLLCVRTKTFRSVLTVKSTTPKESVK